MKTVRSNIFFTIPEDGITVQNAKFLDGRFLEVGIPSEYDFLNHYFKAESTRSLVVYYLTFGTYVNFSHHTGYKMRQCRQEHLVSRLNRLLQKHEEATRSGDFALVAKIVSGQMTKKELFPKNQNVDDNHI